MGGSIKSKTAVKIGYKTPDLLKDYVPPEMVDDPLQFQA